MSKPLKADGPFPPPEPGQTQAGNASAVPAHAPEPDARQALGASALLDAWKGRESALNQPAEAPGLLKPRHSPFQNSTHPPETGDFAAGPAVLRPAQSGQPEKSQQPKRPTSFALRFVAIAATAGLGGWLLLNALSTNPPSREKPDAARLAPVELASGQLVLCPAEPVVPVAGDKDGQLPMQTDVSGLITADIDSFVVLGREAQAAGRARDAEVALLMSCRIADTLKGAASVESADAKYRLAAHYADLNLREGPAAAPNRTELLARAQTLYADSVLTYSARFGEGHEKSRLAAERLASVRLALAQKAQPASAVPVSPAANGSAGAEKSPNLPQPGMAARPEPGPLPAAQPRQPPRPAPPAVRECPPAVETLGLCNPAS